MNNKVPNFKYVVFLYLLGMASIAYGKENQWSGLGPNGTAIRALEINQSNPSILFISDGQKLQKTENKGKTWRTVLNDGISAIAIDPKQPKTVYAGAGGVYKSTDGGNKWIWQTNGPDESIIGLVIDPKNPSIVYASTHHGVYKTKNKGASWSAAKQGLPDPSLIWSLAIDPKNPATLYAGLGTGNGGMYKTTDSGNHWNRIKEFGAEVISLGVTPSNPNFIYAGTPESLHKSTDGGDTWQKVRDEGCLSLAVDPRRASLVTCGGYQDFSASADGGKSWQPIMDGLGEISAWLNTLRFDHSNPAKLYWGIHNGVFRITLGNIPTEKNVVLLLHGMNSDLQTWNKLVNYHKGFDQHCTNTGATNFTTINPVANSEGVYCFRMNFGSLDRLSTAPTGLDGKSCNQNKGCSGDYSTFETLETELGIAIKRIKSKLGDNTKIILLGHSRGGLAARTFLQGKRAEKSNVVGLITTGTPHAGSPLGRYYFYLNDHCTPESEHYKFFDTCYKDWAFVNAILVKDVGGLDMKAPTIGFLAEDSSDFTKANPYAIRELNDDVDSLPDIKYTQIFYKGTNFGCLGAIRIFPTTCGYDIFSKNLRA